MRARTHREDPDEEHEPDYRFTLANERTFLAWVRTALALLAGGIAVVQVVPALPVPALRPATAGLLVVLAVLAAVSGVVRWHRAEQAMRRDSPLPRQRTPWIVALGLIVLALLALVLVLLRGIS